MNVSKTEPSESSEPIGHRKLAVLETDTSELLDELAKNPEIRVHFWRRLDARRMLIHPHAVATLADLLEAHGTPPRFSRDLPE